MASERDDPESRRRARASWPITRHQLGDEPLDDLSDTTTPAERIAMMAELAESAWLLSGRALPTYNRSNIPGKLFPPGTSRPEHDET